MTKGIRAGLITSYRRISRWHYLALAALVLVTLILHFSIITQPGEPVFDEQHYVPEARAILEEQDVQHPEHPALGKLFIVSGIFLFGDNPVGWRFFSVVFGTVSILLFYLVCRRLFLPPAATLIAVFLLALENLSFLQASVAMLDVYSLTFMLGAFWLYLRKNYVSSGLLAGLAALAKLSGALAVPVILLHWLFTRREKPGKLLAVALTSAASFGLLLPLVHFAASGRLVSPFTRIGTMLGLSSSLTFTSTSSEAFSRPWDWILRPEMMFYWYDPHYIGAISFSLWALIIPAVLYLLFRAVKGSEAVIFWLAWFGGVYLVWIPLSLIMDRISFVYYFYPAVGAIAIALAMGMSHLLGLGRTTKRPLLRWLPVTVVSVYLLIHLGVFVVLSPVFAQWLPWTLTVLPE